MDQDRILLEFLKSSKQKIAEFIEKNESDEKLENLLTTTKEISKCIDCVINFFTPCFSEYSHSSIKKYEDCVYINRNVNSENEIALLLQQIQNESSDFLSFLENLQVVFSSLYLISPNLASSNLSSSAMLANGSESFESTSVPYNKVSKTNILSLHKENNSLLNELEAIKHRMVENDNKLNELDKVKEKCGTELNRCVEILSSFSQLELDKKNINNRLLIYEHLNEYKDFAYLSA